MGKMQFNEVPVDASNNNNNKDECNVKPQNNGQVMRHPLFNSLQRQPCLADCSNLDNSN